VYCAGCCVGAPRVYSGLSARVDGLGKPACELCGRRLSKVKHHRPHGPGRACRSHEVDLRRACAAAVIDDSPPVRSHKRKLEPEGKPNAEPSVTIAPPSPPTQPHSSWHTHGTSFRSSTRSSRAAAVSWHELARDSELDRWEKKRGGFYQHDTAPSLGCSFLDEKRVRLRHSAERIARAELSALGVDATSLRLAAIKLLRSSKGEGLQEIHYDIPKYDRAVKCFTVLMYLTPTLSTAVPILSMDDLRHCFTEGEKRPSAAALEFLSRDKFQSERVAGGDMLVLNCTVPHYGVANPDEEDRYVLFLLFYPSDSSMPDTEEQRYPHGVKD
jgi:hypothetical protein